MQKTAPKTILIVDDNRDLANMIGEALHDEGYLTEVLLDGRALLHVAKRLQPDLILLDAFMPHVEVREQLEQLQADAGTRRIPVLLLTGDPETAHQLASEPRDVAVAYVLKPFELDHLIAKISRAI